MGIIEEWKLVKYGVARTSLDELALKKPEPRPNLIVGIDADRWACEAWHLEHAGVVLEDTEHPMLWTIFCRLARLYGAAVVPLFVCSGTKIPGPRLDSSPDPITPGHSFFDDMRQFVEAFGFVWFEAPGEALPELASMNCLSHIDIVMSEDSDAMGYGAEDLVRRVDFSSNDGAIMVDVMRARLLRDSEGHSITRGSFLLMVVLSGSGNLAPSVEGCELSVAHMLARGGLGDRLYNAAATMSNCAFRKFLVPWRKRVRYELETNSSNLLDRVYVALSYRITDSWPDIDVIKMFVKPTTTSSQGLPFPPAIRRPAQLKELARLCERQFSFGTPVGVLKVFESRVWHGLAVDALIQRTMRTISLKKLKKVARIKGTNPLAKFGGVEYWMEVTLTYAIQAVLNGLAGTRAPVEAADVDDYVEQMAKLKEIWLDSKFTWSVGYEILSEYMVPTP